MQLVADAVATTVAAGTAVVEHTIRRDEPLGPESLRLGRGPADLAARRAALHDHRQLDCIFDGRTVYHEALDDDGARRGWTRHENGADELTSPLWFLDPEVEWLGPLEPLGGRRYRGKPVDRFALQALPALNPPSKLVAAVQHLAKTEPPGPRPVELWLDPSGRIRLVGTKSDVGELPDTVGERFRRDLEDIGGSPAHPKWRTIELRKFGVAADIAIPREDEIVPLFEWDDVVDLAQLAWEHRGKLRGARGRLRRYVFDDDPKA